MSCSLDWMDPLLAVFYRRVICVFLKDTAKIGNAFEVGFFDDLRLGQIGRQQKKLSLLNAFSDDELTGSHTDN